jgi:hypothetical protein
MIEVISVLDYSTKNIVRAPPKGIDIEIAIDSDKDGDGDR